MENTFRFLLASHCDEIVNKVWGEKSSKLFKVGSGKIPIPSTPILYRWWFSEEFVEEYLNPHIDKCSSLKTMLERAEKSNKIEGTTTFYALYFGKSVNGYHRFCQHSTGNIHVSTLRRTLYGLRFDVLRYDEEDGEAQLTESLKSCYCEWFSIQEEKELIECVESICIALGNYPLNIDGNPNIDPQWARYMMYRRSGSEKFRSLLVAKE